MRPNGSPGTLFHAPAPTLATIALCLFPTVSDSPAIALDPSKQLRVSGPQLPVRWRDGIGTGSSGPTDRPTHMSEINLLFWRK